MVSDVPVVEGFVDLVEVGVGGFSRVFAAYQVAFDRRVALKVLNERLADDASVAAFERECQAMGGLSRHPFIVTVMASAFTSDYRPCIVMDLFERGNYMQLVRRDGPLPLEELLSLSVRVGGALATAHQDGVIHGDVKPQNIFKSAFGYPALGDFGIATLRNRLVERAGVGLSPHFVAPELIEMGAGAVGAAADQYSLGATIYTLATGRRPFESDQPLAPQQVLAQALDAPAPTLPETFPRDLRAALRRAMAREPQDRFPDLGAFAVTLANIEHRLGHRPTAIPIAGIDDDATITIDKDTLAALRQPTSTPTTEPASPPDAPTIALTPPQQPPDHPPPNQPPPQPRRRRILIATLTLLLLAAAATTTTLLTTRNNTAPTTTSSPTNTTPPPTTDPPQPPATEPPPTAQASPPPEPPPPEPPPTAQASPPPEPLLPDVPLRDVPLPEPLLPDVPLPEPPPTAQASPPPEPPPPVRGLSRLAIQTPTTAGTYTLSWKTLHDCTPRAYTSGALGRVSMSVVDDNVPPDGEGDTDETSITIDEICNYDFSADFVNVAGFACQITDESLEVNNNKITLAIAQNSCPTVTVRLYLVQSVDGDSRDGTASYSLTTTCGESWSGGGPDSFVRLREGRYTVTSFFAEAVIDASSDASYIEATAVDDSGTPCTGTATIAPLPSHCTPAATSISQSLSDARDVVFEFEFDCEAN